jgi:ankyrin repeat protein
MATDLVFDELLRAGALIDALDQNGNSPAMVAAMVTRYDLVLSLLERGASFDLRNIHGLSLKSMVERDRRIINPAGDQGVFYSQVVDWIETRADPDPL